MINRNARSRYRQRNTNESHNIQKSHTKAIGYAKTQPVRFESSSKVCTDPIIVLIVRD